MKLAITNNNGQTERELSVEMALISGMRGTQAVHDTVVAQRANLRVGTACAKTAGEVSGSNKKPWRQKGTGRARAGSNQSPLWVGGGVVFGPRPRDFSKKVNRKTRQMAVTKVLGDRLRSGDVLVLDGTLVDAPKTKLVVGLLARLKVLGTVLIVADGTTEHVLLACRNLRYIDVTTSGEVNAYALLKSDKIIFTLSAFTKLEERLRM